MATFDRLGNYERCKEESGCQFFFHNSYLFGRFRDFLIVSMLDLFRRFSDNFRNSSQIIVPGFRWFELFFVFAGLTCSKTFTGRNCKIFWKSASKVEVEEENIWKEWEATFLEMRYGELSSKQASFKMTVLEMFKSKETKWETFIVSSK